MEKLEPLYTVGENVKWYSLYEKQFGSSSIRSSNSEYIPERIEGRVLKRDLYTYLPWVGKIPLEKEMRKWQPTLVFLPGKSHGQRSLVGQSVGL